MDVALPVGVKSDLVGDTGRPLTEPGSFFVTGEDNLRINSWNSLAGVTLTITARFLGSDGVIRPSSFTHTPNTNRTIATSDFRLGVGFLLNMSIVASAGAPKIGQTFVQAQIIRGFGGATIALGTFLQGYVSSQYGLGWPGSPIQTATDGEGVIRSITGTDPAAGVEISETVPTGARWELITFAYVFVTSAVAATRLANINIDDGANAYLLVAPNATQAASLTFTYDLAQFGIVTSFSSNRIMVPLPTRLLLMAGHRIRTSTSFLDAGDNYGAPQYLVREWIDV